MQRRILSKIGFSRLEEGIYLAVLRGGRMSLTAIAQNIGSNRTTLYPHVDALARQGYLSKSVSGKRTYYSAEHPEKILKTLQNREKMFEDALPTLAQVYQSTVQEPKIATYHGKEGIEHIYTDITDTALHVKTFFSPERYFSVFSRRENTDFFKQLKEREIDIYDLLEYGEESQRYKKYMSKIHKNIKVLPKTFNFSTDILIYAGKVAMISPANLLGVVIESSDIAQFHESVFDSLWKTS